MFPPHLKVPENVLVGRFESAAGSPSSGYPKKSPDVVTSLLYIASFHFPNEVKLVEMKERLQVCSTYQGPSALSPAPQGLKGTLKSLTLLLGTISGQVWGILYP